MPTGRMRTRRNRTRRSSQRGGTIPSVEKLINETPFGTPTILNKESKFVVATYWWGKNNLNKNLQNPCPEEIMAMVTRDVVAETGKNYNFPLHLSKFKQELRRVQAKRALTKGELSMDKTLETEWNTWVASVMAQEANKPMIARLTKEYTERELGKTGKYPRPFPEMIAEWNDKCQKAGVNYISVNAEFPREDYQNAINGKPLFIKKMLDLVAPRAVLYIDGDMWMHKYPNIFDIDGVDFMARGWNTDSRSKPKSLKLPAFDPYIFETSGGTMYFGNTPKARELLDQWAVASSADKQKGKADDRILSQLFTTKSMIMEINMINLPIEYLWLTDNYKDYLKDMSSPASLEDVYIEHPYCLTGEERAAGQGAAVDRNPVGYDEEVGELINYKREPELFYEYIFFEGDAKKRAGFARYLTYMKEAKNGWTDKPLITLIDFDAQYGQYNDIAIRNRALVAAVKLPERTGDVPPPGTITRMGVQIAGGRTLPLTTSIPEIVKTLQSGTDVELGGPVPHNPEDEFVAMDATTNADGINEYLRTLRIDVTQPMFLSSKNKIITDLLIMCNTLEDINTHIYKSYMFMSRIRWNLYKKE